MNASEPVPDDEEEGAEEAEPENKLTLEPSGRRVLMTQDHFRLLL